MRKPTHPPVLPVAGVEIEHVTAGWRVKFPYFNYWVFVDSLSGAARIFFAALQRCAWFDLGVEDAEIIETALKTAGVKPPRGMSWADMTCWELVSVCEEKEMLWKKWGKQ